MVDSEGANWTFAPPPFKKEKERERESEREREGERERVTRPVYTTSFR